MVLRTTEVIRCVLVEIDNFSKIGWTMALKNKKTHFIKNAFENSPEYSKRKQSLIESDDGSDFVNKIFIILLKNNNTKRYSTKTSLGAVL